MQILRALLATSLTAFAMVAGVQDGLLLCRSERTVHMRCCCVGEAQAESGALPALNRAPCCERTELSATSVPASSTALALHVSAPVLVEHRQSVVTPLAAIDASAVRIAALSDRPCATGPPHRIAHCSLLL